MTESSVTAADLERMKNWFTDYSNSFLIGSEPADSGLRIKITHTINVMAAIRDLSGSLDLNPADQYLAEIIALLHDIGRFKQFSQYGTYADHASANHAALGVAVIDEHDLLKGFTTETRAIIRNVVWHHNQAVLPAIGDQRSLFFLKLLRDADKIDVLRVVTDHYQGINCHAAIAIGLPDTPEITPSIIEAVIAGRPVSLAEVKNLNDVKLLQIGYIFDLNFPRTYAIFRERNYLEKLAASLPLTDPVRCAVAAARRHLEHNGADNKEMI